jgi:hypothetical protein
MFLLLYCDFAAGGTGFVGSLSPSNFCVHWQNATPSFALQLMPSLHTFAFRMSPQLAPVEQLQVPFRQEKVDLALAGEIAPANAKANKIVRL